MNFGNALANRKQRREIKRQQEEAAAARRAASNARSNRGLVGTLGGVAGAAVAGMATGYNPATMAMGYQLGSTLGSGANSMVKPYNEQELTGMPYTQPSSFETINQVAPQVMGAYGAFQERELAKQQNDYTTNLNNLLKVAEARDMAPAATTSMIDQLNSSHRTKYELGDDNPSYMLDFQKLEQQATEAVGGNNPFDYSTQVAKVQNAITSFINGGDAESALAAYDNAPPSIKRKFAKDRAQIEREANAAKVAITRDNFRFEAAVDTAENNELKRDRENLKPFQDMLGKVTTKDEYKKLAQSFPALVASEDYERLSADAQLRFSIEVNLKKFELETAPRLEQAKKVLENAKSLVGTDKMSDEQFLVAAQNADMDEDLAQDLLSVLKSDNQNTNDKLFISKVAQIDKEKTDILGQSVAQSPEVLQGLLDSYIALYEPSNEAVERARNSINAAIEQLPQNPLKRLSLQAAPEPAPKQKLEPPPDTQEYGFLSNLLKFDFSSPSADQAAGQGNTIEAPVSRPQGEPNLRTSIGGRQRTQGGGQENQSNLENVLRLDQETLAPIGGVGMNYNQVLRENGTLVNQYNLQQTLPDLTKDSAINQRLLERNRTEQNTAEKNEAKLKKAAATRKGKEAPAAGSANGNLANVRGAGYTNNAFEGLVDRVMNDPKALGLLSSNPLFQQMLQQALNNRGQ